MPMHWLDVPYLQQTEVGGCLPACVAMVLAYLEEPALQEDISRQVDAPHAVVIVGIHDDAVYLLDPDYPDQTPVVVSIGDFALAWSHFDQACAVISKH